MTPATSTSHTELPAGDGWDFGGYPYGLEPLVLPAVRDPYLVTDDRLGPVPTAGDYLRICERIRRLDQPGRLAPQVARCDVPEDLFWFRWITGHQVCFVIWRLMAQLLDDLAEGAGTDDYALDAMCRYVEGYSAMLLYTGSCPRTVYHLLIRPSMRLRHRGFSGSWAPDFAPVRSLFRNQPSLVWSADTGALRDAVKLHDLVHAGVAAKLVPGGRSLLAQAAVREVDHRLAGMIYDSYFVTARKPVPRHQVVAQLLRRLAAIAQDLAVNGLRADDDRRPAELLTPGVARCEANLVGIMSEVARHASGLVPESDTSANTAVAGTAAEVVRT
jgi:hypothetical protein